MQARLLFLDDTSADFEFFDQVTQDDSIVLFLEEGSKDDPHAEVAVIPLRNLKFLVTAKNGFKDREGEEEVL